MIIETFYHKNKIPLEDQLYNLSERPVELPDFSGTRAHCQSQSKNLAQFFQNGQSILHLQNQVETL